MDALPIGSVTRRDGVLNLAAHTPSNANPPDLGPKGYFSETSDDGPDGQGSTKLHSTSVGLLFVPNAVLTPSFLLQWRVLIVSHRYLLFPEQLKLICLLFLPALPAQDVADGALPPPPYCFV